MKYLFVLLLTGFLNAHSYSQELTDKEKLEENTESFLNWCKVNDADIYLKDGELYFHFESFMFGSDEKYGEGITIDLNEISDIKIIEAKEDNLVYLEFIAGTNKAILKTNLGSTSITRLKTTRLSIHKVKDEDLQKEVKFLKSYKE